MTALNGGVEGRVWKVVGSIAVSILIMAGSGWLYYVQGQVDKVKDKVDVLARDQTNIRVNQGRTEERLKNIDEKVTEVKSQNKEIIQLLRREQ